MKKLAVLTLAAGMTMTFAGASFAASDMSKMSSSEKMAWQKCEGMSQSAMKQDKSCTALMQKYPDAAKSTTGSSTGMSNTSSGSAGMNSQKK
jgi:hypothetical protein